MKRRWHVRTRVLFTLIGLTVAVLLTVGLAFNISVRGYIRSSVAAQLASVSEDASVDRRGGAPGEQPGDSQASMGNQQQAGDSQASSGNEGAQELSGNKRGQSENVPGQPGKHADGRFERITGTTGNAVVLDANGSLVTALRGDQEVAETLAEYFGSHGFDGDRSYQILTVEDVKYAVSVTNDPVQKDCYLVSYVDATAILAFTARINMVLFGIILAVIVLSIILSRQFAKSFVEPVQELSAFAGQIGAGNLTPQEFHFRDIEFETLADSMNRMAAELEESKRKQEVFFQNVSHELRTPLTSIRGNAEGIVYGVMEPQSAARVILVESDKLGGMVEDILYLSRMGKAAPEGAVEPLDAREVLSLCVSEQHAEAEKKGVTFAFAFDESPVMLAMREQDAQRMFGNLLSNAIRYAKSEVKLTCRAENGEAFVAVADDGPGIAEEDLPHVFERFYKGKDGKHGLGLAIAKSVAENYHGTLTARNDGGAVFEARFAAA